jgi:tRNA threonylcarbamoyladenosine modification (KEOPS) complex  Pcc1 subunit
MVSTIKSIEIVFEFEMEDKILCNLLFKTLNLEASYNPNERAKPSLDIRDNILILRISALDSISARAAINSYLKWVNLSLQLIDQMENN